ncbi:MAG: pyridoxamine 5'-phosphate oxidase family protein [Pseudomonadales bacterium]|nr:pyridoxamine 5'-phosphate oxidase family protein [Pseudomonadales bacterium]
MHDTRRHSDPLERLRADRARAFEVGDPCAGLCTVASVDAAGHPAARTLVLRELEGRFAVFTNRTSPKWTQFERSATVAVVVWLPMLNLQYRLQCTTHPVPDALVHASWLLRPDVPKRLDWFYTTAASQGTVIADRRALLDGLAGVSLPEPLTAPPTAAGRYLEPHSIDRLDLAQPDGVHDRRHFEWRGNDWVETVRVP